MAIHVRQPLIVAQYFRGQFLVLVKFVVEVLIGLKELTWNVMEREHIANKFSRKYKLENLSKKGIWNGGNILF